MEALKLIPYIALVLAVAGIVLGASAITLGKFKDTTTDVQAINAINNATKGVTTVAEQQPTLAIIAVMVIIISLLAGTFAYMALFR